MAPWTSATMDTVVIGEEQASGCGYRCIWWHWWCSSFDCHQNRKMKRWELIVKEYRKWRWWSTHSLPRSKRKWRLSFKEPIIYVYTYTRLGLKENRWLGFFSFFLTNGLVESKLIKAKSNQPVKKTGSLQFSPTNKEFVLEFKFWTGCPIPS